VQLCPDDLDHDFLSLNMHSYDDRLDNRMVPVHLSSRCLGYKGIFSEMTDRSALVAIVERLTEASVLCVGDAMLDRFIYGDAERISPEAPIPVLRIERETAMLGGAGNVVRNLTALGARSAFVSVIGNDPAGSEINALMAENQIAEPHMIPDPDRRTSIKTRFVASGQQLLRADRESTAPLSAELREKLAATVEQLLDHVGVLVLSDYGKGVLAGDFPQRLIAAAQAQGRMSLVDPKGTDYSRYRGASVLTPNRKELAEATRMPVGNSEEIVAAAQKLIKECEVEHVLVTRSQDGITLVSRDGTIDHLPAEAREVYDVSGAGDTVMAALAAALSIGASLVEAARIANAAAGIAVGKVGTAAVYADELVSALHHQDLWSGETKVRSLDQTLTVIGQWRRKGLKVGFTNGCFDLLHPGHVSLLAQARGACDRLIVGLNSDASVQRLKGPTRPVQSEAARAAVLASLANVDSVVIFGEETPLRLIESLRPDVLVKGADYTVETVVGADIVLAGGGRVVLAQLEPGHSTTSTIARMGK
jgi:D-beta-D-heptose 7-phosphate kinase/D-beta-D-heptose 1-phosphate adenosyltransferase